MKIPKKALADWQQYKEFMGGLEGDELLARVNEDEPLEDVLADLTAKRPERLELIRLWGRERE